MYRVVMRAAGAVDGSAAVQVAASAIKANALKTGLKEFLIG